MRYLVDRGTAANCQNHTGMSPLHFAVARRHYDIVHVLLDAGASPMLKNRANKTPMDLAEGSAYLVGLVRAARPGAARLAPARLTLARPRPPPSASS